MHCIDRMYVEHDTEMAEFPRTGTQQYVQYIVNMENDVRELENRKAHMACLQYLKVIQSCIGLLYSASLWVRSTCRVM